MGTLREIMREIRELIFRDFENQVIEIEDAMKQSLIGSEITGFEVKRIPRRKTLVLVTIETTAPPVKTAQATYIMSPLKLRVKLGG